MIIGEHRTLGIQQQQSIVEIFLHIYKIYSAQEELSINILIDNDNPTVVSDMVSKNFFLVPLNFGQILITQTIEHF